LQIGSEVSEEHAAFTIRVDDCQWKWKQQASLKWQNISNQTTWHHIPEDSTLQYMNIVCNSTM